jgi:hypothetical protein
MSRRWTPPAEAANLKRGWLIAEADGRIDPKREPNAIYLAHHIDTATSPTGAPIALNTVRPSAPSPSSASHVDCLLSAAPFGR